MIRDWRAAFIAGVLAVAARESAAQVEAVASSRASAWRLVLTPETASRWLDGARAIHAAMLEWESARSREVERLLVELQAPKNQPYLACRDSLATTARYGSVVSRVTSGDASAVPQAQRQLLAMAKAACGPMPAELFEPDTATGPDPLPDFLQVGLRASGLDRATFILFADRIIHWGVLEARK